MSNGSKEQELPEMDVTEEDKRVAMGYVMDEMSARTSWTALRDIAEEERSKNIALSRQIATLAAQVEGMAKQIDIAQDAIAACPALREWGRVKLELFGSQIIFLTNAHQGAMHTIGALHERAKSSEASLATLVAQVDKFKVKRDRTGLFISGLKRRLFAALDVERILAIGLREVDHASEISRSVLHDVLDCAAVQHARAEKAKAELAIAKAEAESYRRQFEEAIASESALKAELAALREGAKINFRPYGEHLKYGSAEGVRQDFPGRKVVEVITRERILETTGGEV